jgi:hypothetical protein
MRTKQFIFILFFVATLLGSHSVQSQIQLEKTYSHSGTYSHLAVSGDKFFVMDVGLNQCRVYHDNHNLWKTINLSVPANNYLYDLKFLSENLFTTDNSLCIAYIYYSYNETGQYYTYNAKIIKENGTLLREIPGCQYMYIDVLANGSVKLITYSYDYSIYPSPIETAVFQLPGTFVALEKNHFIADKSVLGNPVPNPAREQVSLPYHLPDDCKNATLLLHDIHGNTLGRWTLTNQNGQINLQVASFPRGTYFYRIEGDGYQSASSKLVLQ